VADVVRIDLGPGAANGFAPRTLISGAVTMAYNLYLDAARLSVWGDGTAGTATYGPVHPAEGSTSISIYGRLPAGQSQPAGAYGDTLTVTLQF
jgi:spore coat protein U-like protein